LVDYRDSHKQNPRRGKTAMIASPDPLKNHLLAALPQTELQRWLPHLEFVEMGLGDVLYESGGALGVGLFHSLRY
jgi:hypothetical protein